MLEEVRRGVKKLKLRKAPGVWGVAREVLNTGGEVAVKWLVLLFNMVWRVRIVTGEKRGSSPSIRR